MIRRLLQAHGAEVVHLGHNRSVADIVRAAIQEDADAIAVSSYQGGHNEYFAYMVDMLRDSGYEHIRVIVGGGGTISPEEIEALERHGIEKIYTPEDGRRMGLNGMIDDVFARLGAASKPKYEFRPLMPAATRPIARAISVLEGADEAPATGEQIRRVLGHARHKAPVIRITGTGGAGKSSLTDELLSRLVRSFPDLQIAVVAMDPTRRRSGGALLGDRIRMNSLAAESIFMRSLATRRQNLATSVVLKDVIGLYEAAGFDLIIVETAGIGQSDTEIVDMVDLSLYVMTSEYGAASQLEKIDMLDFADLIVLNKAEKRGAEDSLRDVRKQWRRNHPDSAKLADAEIPVFPTIASRFNDPGVNRLFAAICKRLAQKGIGPGSWASANFGPTELTKREPLIPGPRTRYLADIVQQGRGLRARIEEQAEAARRAFGMFEALRALHDAQLPGELERFPEAALTDAAADGTKRELRAAYNKALDAMGAEAVGELKAWPARVRAATDDTYSYKVRDKLVTGENYTESLSHQRMPKLAVPKFRDWGEILHFLLTENLPGAYPYTGGVYPYRREEEDPIRMFAGEGPRSVPTAASITWLAIMAPRDCRPRSIRRPCMEKIPTRDLTFMAARGIRGLHRYARRHEEALFGLRSLPPSTSVSMTINGPAPMLLAMFMNTAIDQRAERYLKAEGRWAEAQEKIEALHRSAAGRGCSKPTYKGELPKGHDGTGLALLGVTADELLEPEVYARIKAEALQAVRGTVQADILKEDQAQNTCIFSTEFALRMMGDVQQYFIERKVRNFYSVSISGYHIAEAGANPSHNSRSHSRTALPSSSIIWHAA